MSDINLTAYNAFRRDLARIYKTFSSYTQTDFTEDYGTNTDFDCPADVESNLSKLYDLELE
uniref:Uncharacterized protein n=1 Tax=Drosophila melanogaster TaxID=7227 RepID=M9PDN5_DROME|nr:uncharacterized protein Dmel_CG43731 [Drosophila melanogaster]AGB93095.1 uncharacterized protein Dmel_CG17344 [Drosophila melanogaster]|eukprot:NP_001260560.1 uncharacterized protein Dmel_CG43731 [Drosophila melanogaster]